MLFLIHGFLAGQVLAQFLPLVAVHLLLQLLQPLVHIDPGLPVFLEQHGSFLKPGKSLFERVHTSA
jgi:hypothetical protein